MPFENGRFDVAASALVLNFIPDREKAVGDLRLCHEIDLPVRGL